MGLVLYAVLVFIGLRGVPVRQALPCCLLTALLLTVLSLAAMNDLPACHGPGCTPSLPSLALAFLTTLALALLSYGCGVAVQRLVGSVRFGWKAAARTRTLGLHAAPPVGTPLMLSCDCREALLGCGNEITGWNHCLRGDGHVEREAGLVIRTDHRRESLGIHAPREGYCALARWENMVEVHRTRSSEVIAGSRHVTQNFGILVVSDNSVGSPGYMHRSAGTPKPIFLMAALGRTRALGYITAGPAQRSGSQHRTDRLFSKTAEFRGF